MPDSIPPGTLSAADRPFVSVIIPCRNEKGFIGVCLDSVLSCDYPRARMEILVADGMSEDGTRAILAGYARRDERVIVVDNPRRHTPGALNMAIARARGDVIVRMDAHAAYPTNYISRLVEWLICSGADNVGGTWKTCPGDDSAKSRAIAFVLAHPFGVGNAHYRLGISAPKWVDSVPFGCYRRDVFQRIGNFDEELLRNQDDELNQRLIRAGGRILLVPDVSSRYFARSSLRKLWRTYYQYGVFKPLVVRKTGGIYTARQLAPALLVLYLLALPAAVASAPGAAMLLVIPGSAYLAAAFGLALRGGLRDGLEMAPFVPLGLLTLHLSYGFGYLRGLARAARGARRELDEAVVAPLTR